MPLPTVQEVEGRLASVQCAVCKGSSFGIDQRLHEQVPLDLSFFDETGRDVKLREYFGKRLPHDEDKFAAGSAAF